MPAAEAERLFPTSLFPAARRLLQLRKQEGWKRKVDIEGKQLPLSTQDILRFSAGREMITLMHELHTRLSTVVKEKLSDGEAVPRELLAQLLTDEMEAHEKSLGRKQREALQEVVRALLENMESFDKMVERSGIEAIREKLLPPLEALPAKKLEIRHDLPGTLTLLLKDEEVAQNYFSMVRGRVSRDIAQEEDTSLHLLLIVLPNFGTRTAIEDVVSHEYLHYLQFIGMEDLLHQLRKRDSIAREESPSLEETERVEKELEELAQKIDELELDIEDGGDYHELLVAEKEQRILKKEILALKDKNDKNMKGLAFLNYQIECLSYYYGNEKIAEPESLFRNSERLHFFSIVNKLDAQRDLSEFRESIRRAINKGVDAGRVVQLVAGARSLKEAMVWLYLETRLSNNNEARPA